MLKRHEIEALLKAGCPKVQLTGLAGLVAQLADVDLQRARFFPEQRPAVMFRKGCFEIRMHRGRLFGEDRELTTR
ncbi:MAG TPA: hypothetical protein VFD30_17805 [Terriglobia bacterium]|nr:hypothetical protein [Terriglobia bacterium]